MKQPLKIYIIRHGQTVSNVKEIVQGWSDSHLTEQGIYQARCTAIGLKDVPFSACYSGDLIRQKETARIILEENASSSDLPIISDPHFREMYYGNYEKGPYAAMYKPLTDQFSLDLSEIDKLYDHLTCTQLFDAMADNDPDGLTEHADEVAIRMFKGIKRIVNEQPDGGNVLLAASSCCTADLIEYLFPEVTVYTLIRNCSVSIIRYEDDYFYLDSFDDISYRQKGEKVLAG